jgi:GT2 family glycosyltransferase/glycosyltransferase involved in cell wall biosynthesis
MGPPHTEPTPEPSNPGDLAGGRNLDVLILSSYYWPEAAGNAPYVTGFAEHLAARGHRVVVATGFPHYPEWRSSPRGLLGIRERHNGVEIRRRRHYVPKEQSAFTRAVYEASLLGLGTTALPRRAPDAIIGVSPTLAGAVLARVAAGVYRRPYGLVFQDLQGPGALQSGVEGGRRIATLVERAEIGVARGAAAIGVIAAGFRSYFESHGIPAGAIHDLPNWSLGALPTQSSAEARQRLGWSEHEFVCLHAGNMGHKQGLENVLHAAAAIIDPEVRVVLAGDGNERTKLEALAAQLAVANVSFLPSQPTGLYESMLLAADVLLVNQKAAVGEMSLASKLTSYFMAARPVIAAVAARSETARELERAGAGVLVPPDDPRALAESIIRLKVGRGHAEKLGMRGRSYAEEHLSNSKVLERYEDFVITVSRGQAIRRPGNTRAWELSDPNPDVVEARSAEPNPRVSIVIVSFNCLGTLTECLVSLDADRDAVPIEVIVVDNASDDGTVDVVTRRFPWVQVIANHANAGFAHGMNQGIARARGDALLALNPDTIVAPGAIGGALDELDRHPDVGMLGVKLVRPDGTFDHACKRGFPTISSALYYFFGLSRLLPRSARFAHYTAGELGENEAGTVDAINGAFMLVKRSAVEDVGAMDERYWLYAEDIDWCHRFWETGWKVMYWPGVEVVHRKGGSSGDIRSWTLNRAFHRSMWLFYSKHVAPGHSRTVSGLVWMGVWAKFASSALLNALRRQPVHDWSERNAAGRSGVDPGS